MPNPVVAPLADLTVLDCGDEVTAFAARLLGDLGARVVRVEDVASDALRARGPWLDDAPGPERSLAHLLYNGGKASVALALDRAAAWEIVDRLAAAADVVIAPAELSAPARVFFDATRFRAAHPAVSLVDTVFRRDNAHAIPTDLSATAAGGLLQLNGFGEDPPNVPAGYLAYKQTALAAAEAALALALARRASGEAGRVTVGMQEAVMWTTLQTGNQNYWHWNQEKPSRHVQPTGETIFRTRDGHWVSFTVHPPIFHTYRDWVRAIPGAEVMQNDEWLDLAFIREHREQIVGFTRAFCALHDRDWLLAEGQQRGVMVLPVNTAADLAVDPHLRARAFFQAVWHPQFGRSIELPRAPFLTGAFTPVPRPAPLLGAQTRMALRDLGGYPDAEIDAFVAAGLAKDGREPLARAVPAPAIAARPGADRRQPLQGIRIVDFSWAIAGSLATRLLADLGADQIKIESEYRIDTIRYLGVQPGTQIDINTNGVYHDVNANKRAMCLNLNTEQGVAIARDLIRDADIVASNYTPDRMDRWGLGYEALKAIKPDIIVANLAVMGTFGPHKHWRSYGNGVLAACGIGGHTGFPERTPIGLGTLHTDFTVPYMGALQMLAAIWQRQRTGQGAYLELSQYEASVHLLDTELIEMLANGQSPPRIGNRSLRFVPHGVFPAAGDDQWVTAMARSTDEWRALAQTIGRADLADRPDLATLDGRRAAEDELEAAIAAFTSAQDKWEAARRFEAAGVPSSPVEDVEDIVAGDPGMRDYFERTPLRDGLDILVQREPTIWDGVRLPVRRAPRWNEHTHEVLARDLRLDDEQIAQLAAEMVLY